MVLVTYKRVYYISDEDPTLAKVSSDLVQETDRLSIGEGGPAVAVAEGSSSSPYSRSHIKDSRCPLGAGERDGDEMKGCRTSCCHPSSRTPLPLALVS